jgi:hypothetical protein
MNVYEFASNKGRKVQKNENKRQKVCGNTG